MNSNQFYAIFFRKLSVLEILKFTEVLELVRRQMLHSKQGDF